MGKYALGFGRDNAAQVVHRKDFIIKGHKCIILWNCWRYLIVFQFWLLWFFFFVISNSVLTCVKKRCIRLVLQSEKQTNKQKLKNHNVVLKTGCFCCSGKNILSGFVQVLTHQNCLVVIVMDFHADSPRHKPRAGHRVWGQKCLDFCFTFFFMVARNSTWKKMLLSNINDKFGMIPSYNFTKIFIMI